MDRPFPYIGSGIAAARKTMECWLCFRDAIPKSARADIERGIPKVIAGYRNWFDRVLVFGNDDDSLQWTVRAAYDHLADQGEHEADDEMPSDIMWKVFNADIDAWLLGIHAQHPIALFIKPIDEEYSTETDEWHAWTCERIPDQALPIVNALGAKHADVGGYVAGMWRAWVEDQTFERQQELVAALTDAARAELRKRKVLFTPTPEPAAPKQPTLEEAEAIWMGCEQLESPRGLRIEDAFEIELVKRGFDPEYTLTNHRGALQQAERHEECVVLCRAAIASGVEFPSHWAPALVTELVALGRIAEATAAMPDVVGLLESYSPDMLVTAMSYHRAANEPAIEAMLYHAGRAWFTSFTSSFKKTEVARFGAKPSDLPKQFAAWFIGWCERGGYFDLTKQAQLGHFLVWFDTIGKAACAPWVKRFEAERDRRIALRKALEASTDATTAAGLIDQLLPGADAEDAARAFHQVRGHAPVEAYRFIVGALRNEHRRFYRYPRGGRIDAVVSMTWLTLNTPELAVKIEEAYAIAVGYRLVDNMALHFNLACCACRLGKREAALEHAARSLALDYPNPQQIHDDNDLAPLRGDAAFEALFVADAARRTAAKQPAAEDASSKKKPGAKKPAAKKPAAKKPAAKKPAAKKPAAKKRR